MIRLRVTDSGGLSAENDWTINVGDVVDTPIPADLFVPHAGREDGGPISSRLPAPGGVVTGTPVYHLEQIVSGGNVTVNPDGSFTATPAPNFGGTLAFTYSVGDDDDAPSELHAAIAQLEIDRVPDGARIDTFPAVKPSFTASTLSGFAFAQLIDLDGSEAITGARISGILPGITFTWISGGAPTVEPDGTIRLSPQDVGVLTNLEAHLPDTIPDGERALFRLTVSAGERTLPGQAVDTTVAIKATFVPSDTLLIGGPDGETLTTHGGHDTIIGGGGGDILSGGQNGDILVGDVLPGTNATVSAAAGTVLPISGEALAVSLSAPTVGDGTTTTVRVLVSRDGAAAPAHLSRDRAAVNVAVVIDTSGSMGDSFGGAAIPD